MRFPRHALVFIVLSLLTTANAGAESAEYRLGPQDELQIRVFDLRTGSGEVYKWVAFDADYKYAVGDDGAISVPLLGEVQAAGKSTAELANIIGDRLQAKVGLASQPSATVQIAKHRPFYVSGIVQKPGDYEYRPGLTVLQAVSMAGGVSLSTGDALLGAKRDALTSRGDLRVLDVDRLGFEARQARLDAEINGADAIVWPANVKSHQADSNVARLVREEQLLFESRRESLRSQTDVLNQTKALLRSQIESLTSKNDNLTRQLDLSKKELEQVTSLVSRGLAAVPRQVELERSYAQFQSDRLDIQLASLRAQQDLAKAEEDILALANTRRNEALQEATEVRGRLAQTMEKIDTTRALVFQAEVRAPAVLSTDADGSDPDYILTRRVDGKLLTLSVQDGDTVQPGDVIQVESKRLSTGADASTAMPGRSATAKVD